MKPYLVLCSFIIALNCLIPHHHVQAQEEATYIYNSSSIFSNRSEENLTLLEDVFEIVLFQNSSWQKTYLQSTNYPYTWSEDEDLNPIIELEIPSIQSMDNITITYSLKIIRLGQSIPNINYEIAGNLSEVPPRLYDYCRAEGSYLVHDAELRSLAEDILVSTGNTTNVLRIVIAIADWIGTNIRGKTHERPLYPNETYTLREGDCDDQAILLITLCRILNIPSYLQIGCIYSSQNTVPATYYDGHITSVLKNVGYHGWAMIYIPPWGWLPFDMTLGWRKNTFQGITSAMAWKNNVMTLCNFISSDWAGLGKQQKNYILANSLYIYSEESLKYLDDNMQGMNILPWLGVAVILILIAWFARKKI